VICANQIARQFGAFNPPHARATKLSRCNSRERAKKENAVWQAVAHASIERLSYEIYLKGQRIRWHVSIFEACSFAYYKIYFFINCRILGKKRESGLNDEPRQKWYYL